MPPYPMPLHQWLTCQIIKYVNTLDQAGEVIQPLWEQIYFQRIMA
jgi:hypothetical protein